jgi:low temperature requirement protein LtrA
MAPRDPGEAHRPATPLELLFDLCFVVAVAQASSHLHHGLTAGRFLESVGAYGLVFFAIWWAWMNFTWFASAYDADDAPYRAKVLVQIAGGLVLAAGIPRAFERRDFTVVTVGYVVMRTGLVGQWLRAARGDAARRRTAHRYAAGVTVCQVGWIGLLAAPADWWLGGWFVLALAELLVPVWAERAQPTTWHARHIAERYGLFTLIVLGESVLSATVAIQSAIDTAAISPKLAGVIGGGLLLLFSMWWVYFDEPMHRLLVSNRVAFLWGYGHFVVFASTAAVGAGLAVSVDHVTGRSHVTTLAAGAVIAIPVALYALSVWALHVRPSRKGPMATAVLLGTVALVLAASASSWAVLLIGLLLSVPVAVSVLTRSIGSRA